MRAALILALALAGCGGGGSNDTHSPAGPLEAPAPSCTPDPLPIQIHAYGDSTMQGRSPTINPAAALQRLLDQRFGPGVAAVTNHALGGRTAAIEVQHGKLRPISLHNYGINDSITGPTIEQFKATLRALDADVIVTALPTHAAWYWRPANYDEFPQASRDVAAETGRPLVDMHRWVSALPNWQALMSDGYHPDEALAVQMGQPLFDVLAPMVARRACR